MAISKEKINRELHSCPLVFHGCLGSGIALGTAGTGLCGGWWLTAECGSISRDGLCFQLVCTHAIQVGYWEWGKRNISVFLCKRGHQSVFERTRRSALTARCCQQSTVRQRGLHLFQGFLLHYVRAWFKRNNNCLAHNPWGTCGTFFPCFTIFIS